MGVTVIEKCTVKEVSQENHFIRSVSTNYGRINCEYFVNCAGFWARSIGEMSEPTVKVPLQAAEHYFLHTKTIDNLDRMMPVIRDLDGQIYIREVDGRILAGGFDEKTKPAFENVTIPCKLGIYGPFFYSNLTLNFYVQKSFSILLTFSKFLNIFFFFLHFYNFLRFS